jgi:hypothetical protein
MGQRTANMPGPPQLLKRLRKGPGAGVIRADRAQKGDPKSSGGTAGRQDRRASGKGDWEVLGELCARFRYREKALIAATGIEADSTSGLRRDLPTEGNKALLFAPAPEIGFERLGRSPQPRSDLN